MASSRVYAKKTTTFEQRSSVYALGTSMGLVLAAALFLVIVGYSAKTSLTVPTVLSAMPIAQVVEPAEQSKPLRLPPIQHQLLSRIKTVENPVIQLYAEEIVPKRPEAKADLPPPPPKVLEKETPPEKEPIAPKKKRVPRAAKKKPTQSTTVTAKEQSTSSVSGTTLDGGQTAAYGSQEMTTQATESRGSGTEKYSLIATELHRAVERHKRYPRQARRTGSEGVVTLRFTLDASGRIMACTVTRPSGNPLLDNATTELGEKLVGTVIASAKGLGPVSVSTPVRYALR